MRILFSGNPAYGHLFPMPPLARAARRAGHGTAFLSSTAMADAVAPFRVEQIGRDRPDLIVAEAADWVGPWSPPSRFAGSGMLSGECRPTTWSSG